MLVAQVVLTNHERVTPMLSIKEGVMFYYKPPPHVGKHLGATTSSMMILSIMANDTQKNGLVCSLSCRCRSAECHFD